MGVELSVCLAISVRDPPGVKGRTLATRQLRKAGQTHRSARTGAVRLIQRFGSALYLNIHIPVLLLDGVYTGGHDVHGQPRIQWVKASDRAEREHRVHVISERSGRYLESQGLLVRDMDNSDRALESVGETGLEGVPGSSISSATASCVACRCLLLELYLLHPCSRTALPQDPIGAVRYSACTKLPGAILAAVVKGERPVESGGERS